LDHLDVQLIILVEAFNVPSFNQLPGSIVAKSNPVVEISEPNDRVMIVNGAISLEPQPVADCFVVSVPFFVIGETGRKMGRHKTE
jgi:hypothetical protein